MNNRRLHSVSSAFALMVLLGACGEATEPDPDPDPVPLPGTPTLDIDLSRLALPVGANAQLDVVAKDADGNTVANPSVTYSSSDVNVVTVSATGEAAAVATGTASITATFDGVSDAVPVGIVASANFGGDVEPIFGGNCALSGCHVAPNPPEGMELSVGAAYDNIVNVKSGESPLDRVEPGDPDASYLIHKLQGTQGTVGGGGSQMPLNSAALPEGTIDIIRAWIQTGAQNN